MLIYSSHVLNLTLLFVEIVISSFIGSLVNASYIDWINMRYHGKLLLVILRKGTLNGECFQINENQVNVRGKKKKKKKKKCDSLEELDQKNGRHG